MLRFLAALLLAALPVLAQAQPHCWPDLTLPVSVQTVRAPVAPKIGEVVYAASQVGLVFGWTCRAADGKAYKVIAAGPWTAFPADWLRELDLLIRGTEVERNAAWSKYAVAPAWDERLRPDLDAVWALLPVPPAENWTVLADPFRADKKRLVYAAAGGKRGGATGQYVDAGAPCDPVTRIDEFGGISFLSVLGDPAKVARCVKQP